MEETAETIWYELEGQRPFSESVLWELQRQYFAERGVEAWGQGEVPHYITSNPTVANSYAEIVFACWRDQQRPAPGDEPLYLCELGAGSGRFAFHFLRRLTRLCESARVPPASFRYVLTDFAQSNLYFWLGHPCFQEFFESGVLDLALFDINHSEQFTLHLSGKTVSAGTLKRPLVVIANYVFDSVPQELFYINEQQCQQCLVSLLVDEVPDTIAATELLAHLQYHCDYQTPGESAYREPYLEQLLADYRRTLSDMHLLFPATGLRCLQRLKALSKQGLMLLSADKGDHRLETLQGKPAPALTHHGSFSLSVNYHAFKLFCEQQGGIALFPNSPHNSLDVSCLLMVGEADGYLETRRAFQRHVQEFSPDDFFTITAHARQYIAEMKVVDILAYLRLGFYDSHQFARYLPRLMELAPELDRNGREAVIDAVDKVWELYFPLGEEHDLAYQIACLLYEIDDYAHALAYFERSIEIYGEHTGTLFNMAAGYRLIGKSGEAASLLRRVLKYDPDNQEAREMLAEYEISKK